MLHYILFGKSEPDKLEPRLSQYGQTSAHTTSMVESEKKRNILNHLSLKSEGMSDESNLTEHLPVSEGIGELFGLAVFKGI